jgi:mono/diheme cytochrome c family protein
MTSTARGPHGSRARLGALLAGALASAAAAAACDGVLPKPDFERMIDQRKAQPYQASPFFADRRAMRTPPAGTVRYLPPAERVRAFLPLGLAPRPPLTRALLERGRGRFDIVCAACHGVRGDGDSEVARNMDLHRPPSLLSKNVRGYTPLRLFQIITEGYGLMPSYQHALRTDDRWAVIAYVHALQLSESARLADLPDEIRQAALLTLQAAAAGGAAP